MNKLKFYILTSNDIEKLKRHFSPDYTNLQPKDAIVVINTKSDEYVEVASLYCSEIGVEYHITESNGTPARGKNTVLKLFRESDNDYMVQIDGDDYLTPHGVWVYKNLANSNTPPDAVFLWRQKGLVREWWKKSNKYTVVNSDPFCIDFEDLLYGSDQGFLDAYREAALEVGRPAGDIEFHIQNTKMFWEFQYKYCEPLTQHCRLTFLSKKSAEIQFPEEVVVGEDTLHYYILKNEQKKGNLKVFRNTEYPPTYIYDQTVEGTVVLETRGGQDTSWILKFIECANKLKKNGVLHEGHQLPDLMVDYPEGYVADDCGYGSDGVFFDILDPSGEINKVKFPANASPDSVLLEYNRIQNIGK